MDKKTTVGLVQINTGFMGVTYLPYTVGLLQAYYQKYGCDKDTVFLSPIFERIAVEKAQKHLESADVAAFSVYVWNFRLSLAIAASVKRNNPNTVIVFGGPQVPPDTERFLNDNPHVDIVCRGEGERVFTQIIDSYQNKDWSDISSISYRGKSGIVVGKTFERIADIDDIPSPYLNGTFDLLMKNNEGREWLALWETNRGCPFSCAFCDWGTDEQRIMSRFNLDRVQKELEWFADNKLEFVFCCDSNFGLLPRDIELARYAAKLKKTTGYPKALSVQNTKNATEQSYAMQIILAEAELSKGVLLATQSSSFQTLEAVGRKNIPFDEFNELQRRFTKSGVETFTDIILALPCETLASFMDGIDKIIDNGQYNRIQFINLSILPNAKMGDINYQKNYGIRTVTSKIINIHGIRNIEFDVPEFQEIVIATNAMTAEDWVKARTWSWMMSFLFFDKILQIPITLLAKLSKKSFSSIVENFLNVNSIYPIIQSISSFFKEQALLIQHGNEEFYFSDKWLGIYWAHDEYCFLKIVEDNQVEAFYEEALSLLLEICGSEDAKLRDALQDAVKLNKAMLKTPGNMQNAVELNYNVYEFFRGVVLSQEIDLKKGHFHYDFESENWPSVLEWARIVVWYGNKKGAYLKTIKEKK